MLQEQKWGGGFPKLGVPFWGVPIIRIIVFWGLILGFPHFGKLPYSIRRSIVGFFFWNSSDDLILLTTREPGIKAIGQLNPKDPSFHPISLEPILQIPWPESQMF